MIMRKAGYEETPRLREKSIKTYLYAIFNHFKMLSFHFNLFETGMHLSVDGTMQLSLDVFIFLSSKFF